MFVYTCHIDIPTEQVFFFLYCLDRYNNIYTSNGVSLHELSVSLSKDRKMSASENDDLCSICADGGDLLLCDLCPRAFHKGNFLACHKQLL